MDQNEFLSLYDFTDQTVLITGGAGVLGIEIARMLAECSAHVIILNRNAERGEKSASEINQNLKGKGRAVYIQGDVLSVESLTQAHEKISAQFGHVDILINAAGGDGASVISNSSARSSGRPARSSVASSRVIPSS